MAVEHGKTLRLDARKNTVTRTRYKKDLFICNNAFRANGTQLFFFFFVVLITLSLWVVFVLNNFTVDRNPTTISPVRNNAAADRLGRLKNAYRNGQ